MQSSFWGKKISLLIYAENSNLGIIKVRCSGAGRSLLLHRDSTFQTCGTISVTKKGVTWAGCNFPAELVWEFSCVRASVCVRKGQAERGRNLLHYALIWMYVGKVQARIFSLGGSELGPDFMSRCLCSNGSNEFPVCKTAHCFRYGHAKTTASTCMV